MKIQHFFPTLPPAIPVDLSKGVTEINANGKEHESSFHPRFIHEGFASMPPPNNQNLLAKCDKIFLLMLVLPLP